MPPPQREFDVVVRGATSFTGRRVAGSLAQRCRAGAELCRALGGRSHAKREAVREELAAACAGLGIEPD
jgi:short subunit dehydrogenase-like uncharacterized protein